MVKQPGWKDCEREGKERQEERKLSPECEALQSQQARGVRRSVPLCMLIKARLLFSHCKQYNRWLVFGTPCTLITDCLGRCERKCGWTQGEGRREQWRVTVNSMWKLMHRYLFKLMLLQKIIVKLMSIFMPISTYWSWLFFLLLPILIFILKMITESINEAKSTYFKVWHYF